MLSWRCSMPDRELSEAAEREERGIEAGEQRAWERDSERDPFGWLARRAADRYERGLGL